jgi:transcriptional regulator with XRE-family HTH domain
MAKKERINTHQPAGAIFRQLREGHRYTKTQLAKILGVSKNHIGEIESGNCYPSFSLFIKMLSLYGYEWTIRRIPKFPQAAGEKESEVALAEEAPVPSGDNGIAS